MQKGDLPDGYLGLGFTEPRAARRLLLACPPGQLLTQKLVGGGGDRRGGRLRDKAGPGSGHCGPPGGAVTGSGLSQAVDLHGR